MKLRGLLILLTGLAVTAVFLMPLLLSGCAQYWEKHPLQHLNIEVVPVKVGNVKMPRSTLFEVEASYEFRVGGVSRWDSAVSFSSSRFATQGEADQAVQTIRAANTAYYSPFLNRACLLPGFRGNYLGLALGLAIILIGVLFYRSASRST